MVGMAVVISVAAVSVMAFAKPFAAHPKDQLAVVIESPTSDKVSIREQPY